MNHVPNLGLQTALKAELDAVRAKVNELQAAFRSSATVWQNEKATLEAKISHEQALSEKHKANARRFLQDVRAAQKTELTCPP